MTHTPSSPTSPTTTFGALLRHYRVRAGMTQEALAERAGLTANAISALERGERQRPYPHTVLALAAALGLDDQAQTAFVAAARQDRTTTHTAGAAHGGEAEHDHPPPPPASPAHPRGRGTDAADQPLGPDGTWLAHTKLAVPAVRPDVVARPHLLAALQRALAHAPLTLLSAPAGSGKTTLLAALASATPTVRWAWLSLDEVDNDPVRFCNGIAAALYRGGIQAAPRLDTGAPDTIRRWMADLINTLQPPPAASRAGLPCVLVLDDLHAITESAIFEMLDYLIERLPPQLRVCLATRHDPPLALARLRARRQLFEVRLPALRFTAAETATLLNTTLELDVTPEQVAAVAERTEGWAAGIGLLASSLEQMRAPADRTAFLDAVRHTDRYVFDFLAEEVLNRQDPFVRMFLLETSVLPELTPARCQAVTGRADAEAVLDTLYRRNLFLVALGGAPERHSPAQDGAPRAPSFAADGHTPAYRYHDLFRAFLHDRLRRELPDVLPALYRRAAAAEPDPLRRVSVLMAGELWNDAADALAESGDTLVRTGSWTLLRQWIDALPAWLRDTNPSILLLGGICAWETYDLAAGQALLERARARFAALGDQHGLAHALARLTIAATNTGDVVAARQYAAQALDLPLGPEQQIHLRASRAIDLLVNGAWRDALADLDQSIALVEAEPTSTKRQHLLTAIMTFPVGPLTALPGGVARFEHVAHLLADQIAGDEAAPLRLRLLQVQAYCSFWRGRWDDTLHACRAMYRLGESLGVQAWTMIEVGGLPPLCAAIRGDAVAAEAALEQLFAWIDLIPSGVTIQHLPYLFWRARLRWLQGRHADVRADYEQIVTLEARYGTHPFVAAIQPLLRGLLALSAGQYDEAQREVEHAAVLQEHAPAAVIFSDARLLLAYVALRRGHTEHALAQVAPLLAAHDHADTPGHIMWEGTPAIELVQLAVERGVHAPFARRVLQLLGPAALPGTTPAPQRIVVPGSSEALSAREIEVLRLIADGASNTTIADRLIISPHTAKRHVANILGKLDAATRTEAALRARDLGLV